MKKILAFLIVLFLVTCQSKKADFARNLTNNNGKYWDVVAIIRHNIKYKSSLCFYFNKSGLLIKYLYYSPTEKRIDEDSLKDSLSVKYVIQESRWKYIDNDSISIMGAIYDIRKLSDDSLIISPKDTLNFDFSMIFLAKSKFQSSKYDSSMGNIPNH